MDKTFILKARGRKGKCVSCVLDFIAELYCGKWQKEAKQKDYTVKTVLA